MQPPDRQLHHLLQRLGSSRGSWSTRNGPGIHRVRRQPKKFALLPWQHINLQGRYEFQKQPDPLNIDMIIHELTKTLADRQVTLPA